MKGLNLCNKRYAIQVFKGGKWKTVGLDWETPAEARSAMHDMVLVDVKTRIIEMFSGWRPYGKGYKQ